MSGPGPRQARLAAFLGRWKTAGRVLPGDSGPGFPFAGTDTYEWVPGGYFLLHRVDVDMGGERVQALEIIGWDAQREAYFARSYDHQGNVGEMQATVRDGTWTFRGDAERFTGAFSDDGATLGGRWERRQGDRWLPWMDVHLTRTDEPRQTEAV